MLNIFANNCYTNMYVSSNDIFEVKNHSMVLYLAYLFVQLRTCHNCSRYAANFASHEQSFASDFVELKTHIEPAQVDFTIQVLETIWDCVQSHFQNVCSSCHEAILPSGSDVVDVVLQIYLV